jgi:hypothetical protein
MPSAGNTETPTLQVTNSSGAPGRWKFTVASSSSLVMKAAALCTPP